jgi:DNA-binding MarR family transcriptional regulator
MPRRARSELLQAVHEMLRKVSAQSVLISDTVATRVGLNSTDLECLDLLYLAGPTTAGKLAAHSGLTTGAMTAVLDRLERQGFARRRRDVDDRRRVLVEVLPRSVALIEPFYAPLAARTEELNARYDDRQLTTIVDYMARALEIGAEHVNWLQTQSPVRRRGTGVRVPRAVRGTRPRHAGAQKSRAGESKRENRRESKTVSA